ncbi:YncE family protein [Picrophilus oshimae]|uniref:40-residue YVTN family beta-propeller repeat-containing protein n=1 Tax=Picrophilus torridus (strain ATCC 700027 / DSM 9790 / JCM 10055 / NBRC 100828 / KAW 2/3) TaxID=1122961 RepID=A0A8G2FWI5_PICTO|nr:hypothetical protein [Picrophilus oshimae]SMD30766.1 40-residue YVTN family beta-propeller repeat-containing protein [Picrophilus oshimae DSM 9789]
MLLKTFYKIVIILIGGLFLFSGFSLSSPGAVPVSINHINQYATNSNYGNIASTTDLLNNSVLPGNYNVMAPVREPYITMYNPVNHDTYVSSYPYEDIYYNYGHYIYCYNITVLNATGHILTTINTGSNDTSAITYNSNNGNVYVLGYYSNTVSVINGSTNRLTAIINVGKNPYSAVFDPYNNYLYVANYNSGNVSVINTENNNVISSVNISGYPDAMAYDQYNHEVYAAAYDSNYIYIINGTSLKNEINMYYSSPIYMIYNPYNKYMYILNCREYYVETLNTSNNNSVSYIETDIYDYSFNPYSMIYNHENHYIYMSGYDDSKMAVLNSSSVVYCIKDLEDLNSIVYNSYNNEVYADSYYDQVYAINNSYNIIKTISTGRDPEFMSYNNFTNEIYVPNSCSGNVSFIGSNNNITGSVNLSLGTFDSAYDVLNGYLYVTNSILNTVSVLNAGTGHIIKTINVGETPEDIIYDPSNNNIYVANECSDYISIISGSSNTVIKNISIYHAKSLLYDPANHDVYVGTDYYDFYVINSSYSVSCHGDVYDICSMAYDPVNNLIYAASYCPHLYVINASDNVSCFNDGGLINHVVYANGYIYLASESNGMVYLISNNKTINSIKVGTSPNGILYNSGDNSIYVANTGSDNISVIKNNETVGSLNIGSYPLGISCDPGNHDMFVTDYLSNSVNFIDNIGIAHVNVYERGLPYGIPWSITINGIKYSTSSNFISMEVSSGNVYNYAVYTPDYARYIAANQYGEITVNGNSNIYIHFQEINYMVLFNETGASGTWHVNINGRNYSSNKSNIMACLPYGNYNYSAYYDNHSISGNFTINGNNVYINIGFPAGLKSGHSGNEIINDNNEQNYPGIYLFILTIIALSLIAISVLIKRK